MICFSIRFQQDARSILSCLLRYSYHDPRNVWGTTMNDVRDCVARRVEIETPESMWDAVNRLHVLVVCGGRGIAEIVADESTAQLNITILAFERKMWR